MCCHKEFPLKKTIYNLITAAAFASTGTGVSASMGPWGVGVFWGLLLTGVTLTMMTVCSRCGYFGRRCGLWMGKLVPLFSRRKRSEEFCKTKPQILCIGLLAAVPAVGLIGSARMLLEGGRLLPFLFLVSMLTFALPHPRWVCRYCAQRERGPCPIGRALVRPGRAE